MAEICQAITNIQSLADVMSRLISRLRSLQEEQVTYFHTFCSLSKLIVKFDDKPHALLVISMGKSIYENVLVFPFPFDILVSPVVLIGGSSHLSISSAIEQAVRG